MTDISNMTLTCLDILPLDKGSSAYTEYTMDEKVLEYMLDEMTEHPLEDIKIGHIHSHNSMSVFFSGTDQSELHDNAPNHNVYLSLIVNNKGDYDCRLAYIAKVSSVMTTQCLNVDGSEISFDTKYDTKEVLVWHNCNVIEEVTTEPVSDSYMELITTLDKSKPNYPQFYGRNYNRNVIGYGYGQSAIDYDGYEEVSYAKNYGASIKPDKKKPETPREEIQVYTIEEEEQKIQEVILSIAGITESTAYLTDLSQIINYLGRNMHNLSSVAIVDKMFESFITVYNTVFQDDPDRLQKNLYMYRLGQMISYIEESGEYLVLGTYKELAIINSMVEKLANILLTVEKRKF